ncbi:Predicted membrane protein [Catalinimonas alkaloidigena]|uniref:Predicted membrane protein n=1 Tax=Catalinimonas alkaloidigena TaxID=1075417 RepID=A0A1G9GAZ4_9BACT|nr:DUF2339 domain-containing protein [Catalinimonas alkaloidigena]SDK97731.1 Predicted membrane protein [Catalinimonas alkaloidigena]
MSDESSQEELRETLARLIRQQETLQREVQALRQEVHQLKNGAPHPVAPVTGPRPGSAPTLQKDQPTAVLPQRVPLAASVKDLTTADPPPSDAFADKTWQFSLKNLESFVGGNLINKIGILILVIGVGIGAKYAIDQELISPWGRIGLSYAVGAGLLGAAFWLKSRYLAFSAVLLSGAMAILYFVTYFAFDYYHLMPQGVAFGLMVLFTGFTVGAALRYDQQIIAHLGLVGAYGVPFLLSDGSGRVVVLFVYMTILNLGVLALSLKTYWKLLYYAAFLLTWLVFAGWVETRYTPADFALAFGFLTLFYLLFYLTFLGYKLLRNEPFQKDDVLLLMLNSFVFYGLGYQLLDVPAYTQGLGLFTLANAAVHAVVSGLLYRRRGADTHLFYLVTGLGLVFAAIAVPVQFDGHWVTLLWAAEAALLAWIGLKRGVTFYAKLAYPLYFFTFGSLVYDWLTYLGRDLMPFLNLRFMTSLWVLTSFGAITALVRSAKTPTTGRTWLPYALGGMALVVAYLAFEIELTTGLNRWLPSVAVYAPDYLVYEHLHDFWIFNYTLLFVAVCVGLNRRYLTSEPLRVVTVGAGFLLLVGVVIAAWPAWEQLRVALTELPDGERWRPWYFLTRYTLLLLVVGLLVLLRSATRVPLGRVSWRPAFEVLLHLSVLAALSSELVQWMSLAGFAGPRRLGLSVLWGTYALGLSVLGIRQRRKLLRIGAIVLFAITLLKLFLYDLSRASTLGKTLVLVVLGVLMLMVSFLYNKYRHVITEEKP